MKLRLTEEGRMFFARVLAVVLLLSAVPVVASHPATNPKWYIYNIAWMLGIMPACVLGIIKLMGYDI